MMKRWIDISVPLQSGMVHWPDNPPVRIERVHDMNRGDTANVSSISMGSHTGTHMDAPIHFIRNGKGIDAMPADVTVGPARVIWIRSPHSIEPEELRLHNIRQGERILFHTRNSTRCWKTARFLKDYVYVSRASAQYLASLKPRLVGVDYLSVAGYKVESAQTHRELLQAGIWIIEGLNLSKATPGSYELVCLPLRIYQGDGSPARAFLSKKH